MTLRLSRALLAALTLGAALGSPFGVARAADQPAFDKARFAAVVAEARRRARQEDPEGQPWETLDRDKLARMSRMPEFAAIDATAKTALIDQAGAWDLLPFDKPSDAQALWAFWFPERGIDKPASDSDRSLHPPEVFHADAKWGRQAGAQVALMHCLPTPMWYVQHADPMVWAMEHGGGWDQPNVFDFGKCVRMQSDEGDPPFPSSPLTARGKASAAILEQKLSDYLLAHRCSGKGPDSCLPLLHALASLSPDSDQLPAIVKAIEPDLALATPVLIPPALAGRRGDLSKPESDTVMALRRVAVRRLIFLTAKLPVLMRHPDRWPASELEQTWRTAFDLSMLMHKVTWIQARGDDGLTPERHAFSNPWALLPKDAGLPAATQEIFVKLGRQHAAVSGCDAGGEHISSLPDAFWIAYGIAKLESEHSGCGAFRTNLNMARMYAGAVNGKPGALTPLAGLRKYLDQPGAAHDEIISALAAGCPDKGKLKAGQKDPWNVCRQVALAAAKEEEKRKREEAELARLQPAPERPSCPDSLLRDVGTHLGMGDFTMQTEEGGTIIAADCKQSPDQPALTLTAIAYDGNVEYQKNLFIGLVDQKRRQVVSSLSTVIDEDAIMTIGAHSLGLDTARYILAPGVRAFGLDVTSTRGGPRCADGGSGPMRTLYVRQGKTIRPILLDFELSNWTYGGEGVSHCGSSDAPDPPVLESRLSLAIAATTTNGYADLLVNIANTVDGKKSTRPAATFLLHYNGKTYPFDGLSEAIRKSRER
jgi:hypothetical protein